MPFSDAVRAYVVQAVLAELFVGEHASKVLFEGIGTDVTRLLLQQLVKLQFAPYELQMLLFLLLGVELCFEHGLQLVEEEQITVFHISVNQQVVLGGDSLDYLVLVSLV